MRWPLWYKGRESKGQSGDCHPTRFSYTHARLTRVWSCPAFSVSDIGSSPKLLPLFHCCQPETIFVGKVVAGARAPTALDERVARKSSRQDPGETRDWPPPSAPRLCAEMDRGWPWAVGHQGGNRLCFSSSELWPLGSAPCPGPINQTLCFGPLSLPQDQECLLRAPECPPSPQLLGCGYIVASFSQTADALEVPQVC